MSMTAEIQLSWTRSNRQARRGKVHPRRRSSPGPEEILPLRSLTWIEAGGKPRQLHALCQACRERGVICYSPRTTSPARSSNSAWITRGGEQDLGDVALPAGRGCSRRGRGITAVPDRRGPRARRPGDVACLRDPDKLLLDPLREGEVFFPPEFDREAARRPGSNLGRAPLGVLPQTGVRAPDPVPDRTPPRRPDTAIMYEMHVRGFTRNPNSGVPHEHRGHLRRCDRQDSLPDGAMGITIVELLPVQQFDPQERAITGATWLSELLRAHAGYALDAP